MSDKSRYKLSKYNIVFNRDEMSFIWNSVTGALVKIDDSAEKYIKEFNGENDNSVYFDILKSNGFVIKSDFDETGKLLDDEKKAMVEKYPEHLHYTIAPGLGCNYNCVYCFEKSRVSTKVMNSDMQHKVCDYIINTAKSNNNLKHLAITWFGGEPLLYTKAIKHISDRLMSYCQDNNIVYTAGIVTNGRYLTAETAEMLKTCNVEYIQLAIDGMSEFYAAQKRTSTNDFYAVVDNVITCADIIPITIRINVDQNISEAFKLTDYLLNERNLDGRIKIYIAHVRDYENRTFEEEALTHKDYLKKEWKYINQFMPSGPYDISSLFFTAPKRRCTTCPSVCATNYCIGPEGEFYRCEHFFGQPKHVVGTIETDSKQGSDNNPYLKHTHPQKCLDCPIFPVCLGGCMNDVKDNRVSISCEDFIKRQIDYLMLSTFKHF